MVIALLLWYVDVVFEIFRIIHRVQFGGISIYVVLIYGAQILGVGHYFIGEENFMHNPIQHPRSKRSREIFFILFTMLTWEDTYELTTAIVFNNSLVDNISVLDEGSFFEVFL